MYTPHRRGLFEFDPILQVQSALDETEFAPADSTTVLALITSGSDHRAGAVGRVLVRLEGDKVRA
jgi:hypothetical protein